MTSLSERQHVVSLIQAAHRQGARLARACEEAGLALRSYRRWVKDGVVQADKRPTAVRPKPANIHIFDIISAFHSQNALLKYYELKASKHVNDNEQEE